MDYGRMRNPKKRMGEERRHLGKEEQEDRERKKKREENSEMDRK